MSALGYWFAMGPGVMGRVSDPDVAYLEDCPPGFNNDTLDLRATHYLRKCLRNLRTQLCVDGPKQFSVVSPKFPLEVLQDFYAWRDSPRSKMPPLLVIPCPRETRFRFSSILDEREILVVTSASILGRVMLGIPRQAQHFSSSSSKSCRDEVKDDEPLPA